MIAKFIAALVLVLMIDSAAAVQLGGTSGLALLEGLQNNSSVAGAVIPEADGSVMETPSQAVLQGRTMSRQEAPSNFVLTEGFGKSTKGVFDATGFKAPAQSQWPRVYT